MTLKKRHNKISVSDFSHKAKKSIRRTYKKTISKSKIRSVWNDYCELAIINPLLKYGNVEIEKGLKLEIVGKEVINDSKYFSLFKRGVLATKTGTKENKGKGRMGVVYKIRMTDDNCKNTKLIFEANNKLKKLVHDKLVNSTEYYKIEK